MGKIIEANGTEVEEIIKEENNLVLLDFYANWCGPCKALSPVLQKVSEEVEDVTIIKVNVDNSENHSLSSEYGVRGIPAVFVLKEGQEVDKFMGLKTKDYVLNLINENSSE